MSKADEITKLKDLLDQNVITQEEFDKEKERILNKGDEPIQVENRSFNLVVGLILLLGGIMFAFSMGGNIAR